MTNRHFITVQAKVSQQKDDVETTGLLLLM